MLPLLNLLTSFDPESPHFRPTEIYNEGWLLRIVLHLAAALPADEFALGSLPGAIWYSEAQLPTAFKARFQGDPLAEARTHADGAIGHFTVGGQGKADLALDPDARQLVVVEAKIHSPLSGGTSNAPFYDQAARSVACMAEALRQAGRQPSELRRLGYVVAAPRQALAKFEPYLDKGSMRDKVRRRVAAYAGELDGWFSAWFEPTLERVAVEALGWEDVLAWLGERAPEGLGEFYARCLAFN